MNFEKLKQWAGWLGVALGAVVTALGTILALTPEQTEAAKTAAQTIADGFTQVVLIASGVYTAARSLWAIFFGAQAQQDAETQIELKRLDLEIETRKLTQITGQVKTGF